MVIDLLRERFGEQATTDQDDRLGHGSSPNTYHGEPHLPLNTYSELICPLSLNPAAAVPAVVVYAESTEDVSDVMKIAYAHRVPVTPFSGGTSLEGHITCPYGGICVDLSRMDQILEVHEADSDAVVQAGVAWENINEELKERGLKLFFPLDPGPAACIGGMMATGCR